MAVGVPILKHFRVVLKIYPLLYTSFESRLSFMTVEAAILVMCSIFYL